MQALLLYIVGHRACLPGIYSMQYSYSVHLVKLNLMLLSYFKQDCTIFSYSSVHKPPNVVSVFSL